MKYIDIGKINIFPKVKWFLCTLSRLRNTCFDRVLWPKTRPFTIDCCWLAAILVSLNIKKNNNLGRKIYFEKNREKVRGA